MESQLKKCIKILVFCFSLNSLAFGQITFQNKKPNNDHELRVSTQLPELDIPSPPPIILPVQSTILLKAQQAERSGDYKGALALYEQHLQQYPDDQEVALIIIRINLQQGNYQTAQFKLNDYANKFPLNDDYYTEKARYFALTNNSQAAWATLKPLLVRHPSSTQLLEIKNYLSNSTAQINETELNPTVIKDSYFEARQAEQSKNYQKAINLYRHYHKQQPNDNNIILTLIRLYLMQGNYQQAEILLHNYPNKFGYDNGYYTERARYYALTNNSKKALEILFPLIQKDPENKTLLDIKQYALSHSDAKNAQPESRLSLAKLTRLKCIAESQQSNDTLYYYLAKAYYDVATYDQALYMIDKAILINPCSEKYLKLRVKIGKSLSRDDIVYWSYDRLYALDSGNQEYILELARHASQSGCIDVPANLYAIYTSRWPGEKAPWLEWAYIENWRGDYRKALKILNHYYHLFGTSKNYLLTKANVLASANWPRAALKVIDPLMCIYPQNYDLNYARTVALYYANQPIRMFKSLDRLNVLQPNSEQTLGLNDFINTPFRSNVTFDGYDSFDTDTIKTTWSVLTGQRYLSPVTSLLADVKRESLSASISSGLAPISGGKSIYINSLRAGFGQRFNPYLYLQALIGGADADQDGGSHLVYKVDALTRPHDKLAIDYSFSGDFYDASPLAVSLAIRQYLNQIYFAWEPESQTYITGQAAFADYSDGNEMRLLEVNPKTFILASEKVNVVVGVEALWYSFTHQLSHGYYDPANYEFYAINGNFTFKQSDNINYVLQISRGTQKDETFRSYAPANDYSFKAYFGIYKPWYLILSANASTRGRAISNVARNTYEVYSFLLTLSRRF